MACGEQGLVVAGYEWSGRDKYFSLCAQTNRARTPFGEKSPTDALSKSASPINRSSEQRSIMEWLSQNWVWALFFAAFIAMHMFGHGGHGGHGGHTNRRDDDQTGA